MYSGTIKQNHLEVKYIPTSKIRIDCFILASPSPKDEAQDNKNTAINLGTKAKSGNSTLNVTICVSSIYDLSKHVCKNRIIVKL